MLSDRHCELLTAFVDGELDARERQVVDRLLSSSPDARDFLDKLQADSKELHNLPARKAPETLADSVMVTLNDNEPRPIREPRALPRTPVAPPPQSGLPMWLGLLLAACVLAAVSVGTFFFAGSFFPKKPDDNLAKTPPVLDPFLANLFGEPAAKFGDDVKVQDAGVRLIMGELQEEPVKKRLANELKKERGFWFDVPTANHKLAIHQWTGAFKDVGFALVDTTAKAKQKQQDKAQYVLYAENLSAEDVATVLQNASHTLQAAGKAVQAPVLMTAITVEKRTLLAAALGLKPEKIDPGFVEPKLFTPIEMKDPGKKASEQPKPQRFVVLLAMNASAAGQPPAELKSFLDGRHGLRQGTLQMVLVIHEEPRG